MREKISFVIITLSIIIVVGGCVSKPIQPAQPEQPLQVVELSPMDKEQADLEARLDRRYSDPQAHYELGQLYRQKASWEKANIQYNITLQFDPGHKKAQAAMVKMNIEQGESAKSKILSDIYINQASSSAEALLYLGRAFQDEALDDYAFICFDKALMLAPNSAALHKQMGYYYKRKGDIIRAEEAFKRSIQLDPYNAEVAGELGRMGVVVEIPRKQDNAAEVDKLDEKLNQQQQQ